MADPMLEKYKLARKVLEKELSVKDFAERIGKSYRQAQRILKRIRELDFIGVLHGNRGRTPRNKLPQELEARVAELRKSKYPELSLAQFRKVLQEEEGIEVKKTTLEKWMKKHQLTRRSRATGTE